MAERLFGHQYALEILMEARGKNVRSSEWVKRLPHVIKAINDEPTRLIGMKPSEATTKKKVLTLNLLLQQKNKNKKQLPCNVGVRYLYQPGELEGGERKRATHTIWNLDIYRIETSVIKPDQPIVYYLNGIKRGFVRKELLVVPPNTELPPDKLF